MPWFKIDDGFHGHPKVVELPLAAVGLWVMCGTWCAQYLTDGKITEKSVFRLGGDKALAQHLVDAGLWIKLDDGYEFKDWSDYQPMRATVMAEREATKARVQAFRDRKRRERDGNPDGNGGGNGGGNGVTPLVRNGSGNGSVRTPRPDPTRPVLLDVSNETSNPESDAEAPDAGFPDVVHDLCEHLADWIENNGSKRPTVGATWLKACDRLMRIDGRTPEQIRAAIDWCQRDEFWQANILSMPKLREKYEQLRLAAQRPKSSTGRPTADDRVRAGLSLAEQYRQMEQQQENQQGELTA